MNHDDVHTILITLEESLWIGKTRYDDCLMDRTFATEFSEVGRSGRHYQRHEMFFGQASANQEISARLPLDELTITFPTQNTALVRYISHVTYDTVEEHAQRTSLWVWREERWQLVFHQGTPI